MHKIVLMMAVIPLVFGCATAPEAPPAKRPLIFATAEDRARAAEWDALVAAQTDDRARESINHSRGADAQARLAVMRGEKGVLTEDLMGWPRYQVSSGIDAIQKAKTWPDPAAYGVVKATGAITIDGKGTEPDWTRAATIPIRHPAGQTNVTARPVATCRLLWDERNLYMLFEAPDTNIVSAYTNRDESVSQADCVEIFLLPSRRFAQYWEFNFSPTGVIFDTLFSKYVDQWGSYERSGENAALTLATVVDGTVNREDDQDRGYTVEVALPWVELPGFQHGATTGDTVWALIGWADRSGLGPSGKLAYFSHTPLLAWFHNIWGYSRLTLE